MREHTFGLCAGRHDIPIDKYIFNKIEDPTDTETLNDEACHCFEEDHVEFGDIIDIYVDVTSLSVALIAAISAARELGVDAIIFHHYNRETDTYFKQWVHLAP